MHWWTRVVMLLVAAAGIVGIISAATQLHHVPCLAQFADAAADGAFDNTINGPAFSLAAYLLTVSIIGVVLVVVYMIGYWRRHDRNSRWAWAVVALLVAVYAYIFLIGGLALLFTKHQGTCDNFLYGWTVFTVVVQAALMVTSLLWVPSLIRLETEWQAATIDQTTVVTVDRKKDRRSPSPDNESDRRGGSSRRATPAILSDSLTQRRPNTRAMDRASAHKYASASETAAAADSIEFSDEYK